MFAVAVRWNKDFLGAALDVNPEGKMRGQLFGFKAKIKNPNWDELENDVKMREFLACGLEAQIQVEAKFVDRMGELEKVLAESEVFD